MEPPHRLALDLPTGVLSGFLWTMELVELAEDFWQQYPTSQVLLEDCHFENDLVLLRLFQAVQRAPRIMHLSIRNPTLFPHQLEFLVQILSGGRRLSSLHLIASETAVSEEAASFFEVLASLLQRSIHISFPPSQQEYVSSLSALQRGVMARRNVQDQECSIGFHASFGNSQTLRDFVKHICETPILTTVSIQLLSTFAVPEISIVRHLISLISCTGNLESLTIQVGSEGKPLPLEELSNQMNTKIIDRENDPWHALHDLRCAIRGTKRLSHLELHTEFTALFRHAIFPALSVENKNVCKNDIHPMTSLEFTAESPDPSFFAYVPHMKGLKSLKVLWDPNQATQWMTGLQANDSLQNVEWMLWPMSHQANHVCQDAHEDEIRLPLQGFLERNRLLANVQDFANQNHSLEAILNQLGSLMTDSSSRPSIYISAVYVLVRQALLPFMNSWQEDKSAYTLFDCSLKS